MSDPGTNMTLLEEHHAFLTKTLALTRDEQAHEVLAGLNVEETELYLCELNESRLSERWVALDKRHQRARLEMIQAENDAAPPGSSPRGS